MVYELLVSVILEDLYYSFESAFYGLAILPEASL